MDWQLAASLGIVGLAGGYLARRGWLLFARKKNGGCGSCSSTPGDKERVVAISVERMRKGTEGRKP